MTESVLDAKGLRCPLPVLRARKSMKSIEPGDVLEVHSTDPKSVQDFQAFCQTAGHQLLDWKEDDGVYVFHIRKAG